MGCLRNGGLRRNRGDRLLIIYIGFLMCLFVDGSDCTVDSSLTAVNSTLVTKRVSV